MRYEIGGFVEGHVYTNVGSAEMMTAEVQLSPMAEVRNPTRRFNFRSFSSAITNSANFVDSQQSRTTRNGFLAAVHIDAKELTEVSFGAVRPSVNRDPWFR
jgi:hypothetical protein